MVQKRRVARLYAITADGLMKQ